VLAQIDSITVITYVNTAITRNLDILDIESLEGPMIDKFTIIAAGIGLFAAFIMWDIITSSW
jgi:hypothetical protein